MSRDYARAAKLRRIIKQAKERRNSEAHLLYRALRIGTTVQIARHRHKMAAAQIRAKTLASTEILNARYDKLHARG